MDMAMDLSTASVHFTDIDFTANGDLQLVDGTTAILQNILQTLKIFFGEWFLDQSLGIDYFNQILIKNPNRDVINAIFINQILSVPGVISLLSYSFTPNFITRQLTIAFKAQVTNGIVDYAGLI